MKVTIIETNSKKAIETYTIHISGMNYTPTDEEYYTSAWNNAVDDGLVDSITREKHTFVLEK